MGHVHAEGHVGGVEGHAETGEEGWFEVGCEEGVGGVGSGRDSDPGVGKVGVLLCLRVEREFEVRLGLGYVPIPTACS